MTITSYLMEAAHWLIRNPENERYLYSTPVGYYETVGEAYEACVFSLLENEDQGFVSMVRELVNNALSLPISTKIEPVDELHLLKNAWAMVNDPGRKAISGRSKVGCALWGTSYGLVEEYGVWSECHGWLPCSRDVFAMLNRLTARSAR